VLWTPGGGGLLNPYSTVSSEDELRGIRNAEINSLPPGAIPHNTPPLDLNPLDDDSNLNPPFRPK
jgi:hypothetical protein